MEEGKDKTVRNLDEMRQLLQDRANARDEMNLAELPIFLLSSRQSKGVYERSFSRRIFDRSTRQHVHRKLTVTASAKYGLPDSMAEEVCLALIHFTRAYNDFSDPKVRFSRWDLLKTLNWKTDGRAYRRLRTCMDQMRYTGIKSESFWRDNESKEYRSIQDFALIDNYEFRDKRIAKGATFDEELSEFRWGQVLFDSFAAGYLKKLDLDLALSLPPLARRLYRLLDKRFNPPKLPRLEYDLKPFAYEHIGLPRSYDAYEIRRHLTAAVDELVKANFLKPLPEEKRFPEVDGYKNTWKVRFDLQRQRSSPAKIPVRRNPTPSAPPDPQRVRQVMKAAGFD